MNSKTIYVCPAYNEYTFKTNRIWRTDGKYEPFVYFIQEVDTEKMYIGSKTAKNCLESDLGTEYFTSSKEIHWESNPKSFDICKIIPCASNHDAIILEGLLIESNGAIWSDDFYNKSNAGKTFNNAGQEQKFSDKHKKKLSKSAKKRGANEKSICAMINYVKDSKWMKNYKTGKDKRIKLEDTDFYIKHGWCFGRLNTYEDVYASKLKWKETYRSNPKNENRVFTQEHKDNIGKASKGTVPVKDEQGNKFKCSINDPKYISGEYQHVTKGTKLTEEHRQKLKQIINVRDTITGKTLSCSKDDPKYLSGIYVGATKGMKVKCPYCGKEGQPGVMKRWHFDNCKLKDCNMLNL